MKKTYLAPATDVVDLYMTQELLTASLPIIEDEVINSTESVLSPDLDSYFDE